ncbi:MAG: 2,3-diphosphoglycerate-dependent phosphoglycerate mutase [Pelagibacteraceae bacterium]|jgi:2,3-bisphosphoglycerate-dependent phosphoglycerate mutase|nr:2,3-diphosphoglycerate-dependent phosphoglycerate mutase [Pelagibacteraceae bacterium]MBO6467409.1 2,3-diphosphoglycerate-dependent phosphoglycerate mutase [Pelagibacteraceae bacterium]MBO6470067.1 2,3-diphosphoglycerate-dependent phosphoglycerate mutase [Pelagibacteraceae bacterium]MBO6471641.1 2,3-diphosphoglycerate-dependent phosphoglycerate mutase [Pelagibacteraceae bacterium]MBO6478357.1 2,3-diphosphoglycerate-dependent phosphoglycerate mutase [Pelagibacteraceae bacterium]|tara:strand:- start:167 stop:793 length:627 start_codon:yes stop_codon:yes gene_type:complete
MSKLVLLRHGQSQWNLENRFTGWKDIELSENGISEAKKSGRLIKEKKIPIDKVYSSGLKRAIDTAIIAMKEANYDHLFNNDELVIIKNIAVNERDYGDLTGLNKQETAEKYGKEQVHIWRRSYDVNPPGGESLKSVVERVKPYFENTMKKDLEDEKNILLSAHGNSLRALFLILNIYTTKTISTAEIPTGKPFIIEYESNKITNKYFL